MRVRLFVVALLLLGITACSDADQDEIACTSDIRASLSVSVTDQQGVVLSDYQLSYTLNGEPKDEFCMSTITGTVCSSDPFEVVGDFEVTATKAGYRPATAAVTVNSGMCHVITEHITMMLASDN